ncbi:hypothetical protein P8C59_006471 [Phyllachora maydis]|uniref:Retrovirus-related Pol polyprotein from transposon TNT 1-94-like beta-barrel domain-containing protein n=1 Tax=Phyllachora maydis TaxID=1825666 RepID=A0AAD9I7Q5_9PEZI|nr:hypothetical protein P8C59_006471 [Phyllachora maydis]
MHLLRRSCPDPGQSSRPPLPIQTLLEDKEDGADYSEVIEVLKQYIKSHKQVIASQSSDIKTLLLSLNTLKASVGDSVSAIKNISSTLASLTNSSNAMAATTGRTSYGPRFGPFSGTMDLDSPLRPPRKEPHLRPAVNSATSNLDPPIDTGSKEGFKDTITSSIVKGLSKKAYTIPDYRISNFLENPDISNTYSGSDQAVLLMLLRNSLSSGPRAAISNPATEAYRAAHVANRSNSTPNSNSNPSKKGKNKKKGKKKASYNVIGQKYSAKSAEQAFFMLGSYNLAVEEEEEESNSSSNSSSSSDSNTQLAQLLALKGYKKRKDFKGKGLKTSFNNKAKYQDNQPRRRPRDPALYNSWLYNTGSTDHISNSKERFTTFTPNTGQLRPINTGNGPVSPAGIGSIILEVLSRKAPPIYTKLVLDNVLYLPNININIRNKIVVEIPSNSNRKEDYRPIIEDAIVSEAIEPKKRYKLRNFPAEGTTLEGIGPSLRGKRPRRPIEPLATAQAPYQSPCKTREPKPLTATGDLPRMLREPVIEGNKAVEKAISSPTLKKPNIGQRDYYNLLNLAKFITKGLPNFDKMKEADFHCSSCDRGPIVANAIKGFFRGLRNGFGRYPTKFHFNEGTEITDLLTTWLAKRGIKFSTSAPYIHEQNGLVERSCFILEAIVELVNSTAITNRETTPFQALFNKLEPGIPYIPNLERYRAIGARGEAIIPLEKRSQSLKFTSRTEECKLLAVLGSKTYLVYIPSRRAVLKTSTVKFIEDNTVLSQPTDNTALEGELVDLDLDLEGAISPDPSNLNTKKPLSIEIGPSKLEPYESSSNSELDEPLPDKPINPVIVESTRPTISIRKPELPEAFPQTIGPIFAPKPIEVIAPNQPITNEPLNNSDLISKGDKIQLDYYKLLAKTSSYILSFVYKARKRVISKDKLGVFKFLPRRLLPSNRKLITYRNVLKVKKDARNRPIKYKSRLVARGFIQVEGLDYTITYASTSIPPTWHILLAIDDCLFIGPDIGYITDLKKRLNKVYTIEDLGPAAYFLGVQIIRDRPNRRLWLNQVDISFTVQWLSRSLNRPTKSHLNAAKNLFKYLNSTKDYSICFSYNGNTVADLGPKLSNSSNTTTKLSRDFHSKEGPRPLTTTSTTIVDSRNGKGSSRTSIINSSLVSIGFSNSDFAGDKATSKSTYGYLYKLAGRPISWKTKRATTIALSILEAKTNGLTEAIHEVQWIIGLFSELYRPIDHPITLYRDNQGSIIVANNPAL